MSGFVDFVVAHPKDAAALTKSNELDRRWPSASAKFVFNYHLQDLWKLLAQSDQSDDFPELACDGGWNVYSLSAPFVKLLSAVKAKDVPDMAKRWYATWDTPRLQDEAGLAELILELIGLAKKAKTGKTILVRESQG